MMTGADASWQLACVKSRSYNIINVLMQWYLYVLSVNCGFSDSMLGYPGGKRALVICLAWLKYNSCVTACIGKSNYALSRPMRSLLTQWLTIQEVSAVWLSALYWSFKACMQIAIAVSQQATRVYAETSKYNIINVLLHMLRRLGQCVPLWLDDLPSRK